MTDQTKQAVGDSGQSGALSSPISGVEKLLAASGLSAALQPSTSAFPSAALRAQTAFHLNGGGNPVLDLLNRATAVSGLAPTSRQSLQPSASAVESAISSLATAIALRQASAGVGLGRSHGGADSLALLPAPFPEASALLSSLPNAVVSSDAIRQEQITAALRSKPQRGRKRENLNEHERMELTRTRNREHAKSTRIRKKARHEELLEMESKFKSFVEEEERKHVRRQLIHKFLLHREQGFRSITLTAVEVEPISSRRRDAPPGTALLGEIMGDNATFWLGPTQIPPGSPMLKTVSSWSSAASLSSDEDSDDVTHGRASQVSLQPLMQQLESFDASVAAKVASCLGKSAIGMLQYAVRGGDSGIAFNLLNSAFCQVELKLARSVAILRGVVRFDFVDGRPGREGEGKRNATAGPAKIASVQWIPDFDATETGLLQSIDPMVVVAMAAESAEALHMTDGWRNWGPHHDLDRGARSSSPISSSNDSVVSSPKENARNEGGTVATNCNSSP